jgi:hypothetical protein
MNSHCSLGSFAPFTVTLAYCIVPFTRMYHSTCTVVLVEFSVLYSFIIATGTNFDKHLDMDYVSSTQLTPTRILRWVPAMHPCHHLPPYHQRSKTPNLGDKFNLNL